MCVCVFSGPDELRKRHHIVLVINIFHNLCIAKRIQVIHTKKPLREYSIGTLVLYDYNSEYSTGFKYCVTTMGKIRSASSSMSPQQVLHNSVTLLSLGRPHDTKNIRYANASYTNICINIWGLC